MKGRLHARLTIVFVLGLSSAGAGAQVYKCTDAQGKTLYADAPCGARAKALDLHEDRKPAAATATACTQLLDETRRLAADAERDARRGRPTNAANAKRRTMLDTQYQQRCAGISRSR